MTKWIEINTNDKIQVTLDFVLPVTRHKLKFRWAGYKQCWRSFHAKTSRSRRQRCSVKKSFLKITQILQ